MTPSERADLEKLILKTNQAKDALRVEYRSKGFPEDLDLCFLYNEDGSPYVREELVQEILPANQHHPLQFMADWKKPEELPALPFLMKGEAWHQGWDIPTRWVIDARRRCWVDNAHGHALSLCTQEELISTIREDDRALRNAHAALGKKPPLPEWMKSALNAEWTPPEGFDRSNYE